MAISGKKFGLTAIGKVTQSFPATDATITAISNRVAVLEGQSLDSRIDALEATIALLVSHTHDYDDDNGTTTVTKTTESN